MVSKYQYIFFMGILYVCSLDILITPEPHRYAVGREGEDIKISCIPSNNTAMNWFKSTQQVRGEGLKYNFSPPGMGHTLTIKKATKDDSGIYSCSPSTINSVTAAIQVIVINGKIYNYYIIHLN